MREHYFSEWKNKYSILEDGTVRKHKYDYYNEFIEFTIVKPILNKTTKTQTVYISYPGILYSVIVGRMSVTKLLGMAFVPNPEKKKYLSFKDGDNGNWEIENLIWRTCSEMRRAYRDLGMYGSLILNKETAEEIRNSSEKTRVLAEKI